MSKQNEQLTYERAYAELSTILQTMQGQETGLEEMTVLLRRARELIVFCREQLHLTERELKSIFDEEEE